MKRSKWLKVVLAVLILLTASACEGPYSNPSSTFQDSDLVGTWEAHYVARDADRLILRADGTFKQVYEDHTVEDYIYETPWNEWGVEHFPDGRVQLHLQGARYYNASIRLAERDGMSAPGPEDEPDFWGEMGPPPFAFYDPIAKEALYMVRELVLNVRSDSSGELLLLHMWISSDRGFALIGGETKVFRRIETP